MVLTNGKYDVDVNGIWIAKSELERLKKHYEEITDKTNSTSFSPQYYDGKRAVLVDILKMFEPLEGE